MKQLFIDVKIDSYDRKTEVKRGTKREGRSPTNCLRLHAEYLDSWPSIFYTLTLELAINRGALVVKRRRQGAG